MMYKGGIKIFLLLIICLIIGVSAVMFGYDYQGEDIKDHAQNAAEEVMETGGKNVVDKGKEVMGETLKDVGEKMLYEKLENPGFFGEYNTDKLAQSDYVILFFTAPWCPSCLEAQNNIEENKAYIPADTTILLVDFDQNLGVREKYDVTKQHTFVLLDREQNEVKRWTNSTQLKDILINSK